VLAGPLQASDDDALTPGTRAARAHFHAGQAYFRRGELRRALAEFQLARQDDARPELDYNLGLTYDRLGDAARAIDAYRRFLAAGPEPSSRAEVEDRLAALEPLVGELVLATQVPDALITVDGEPLPVGAAARPLRLTSGAHTIVAAKEPWLPQRRSVQVKAGQRVELAIDPRHPQRGIDRRTKLGIGLGVGAAGVAIVAIALGVYFGTRAPGAYDPGGAAGVVGVRPLALALGRGGLTP
jgi:hypothetical protein